MIQLLSALQNIMSTLYNLRNMSNVLCNITKFITRLIMKDTEIDFTLVNMLY